MKIESIKDEKLKELLYKYKELYKNKYIKHFGMNCLSPVDENGNLKRDFLGHFVATPKPKTKEIGKLFGFGTPSTHTFDDVRKILNYSEKELEKYHRGNIYICQENIDIDIKVSYYETDDEVYDRLEREYNRIIENIEHRKNTVKEDYKKLMKLENN